MEDSPNTWSASTVNYLIPTQQEGYGAPTSTGRLLSRGRPSLGTKRTLRDISKIRCTSSSVGHISCLPNLKTIAFASQHFTAAMIRSQCWFTFDFILHQIFWSPLLNDVKQLLIAAIMPSKLFSFGKLGDRRWTRYSTWCSILKENSIKRVDISDISWHPCF